mmetsp:Transcript_9048/g.18283  ORF Transcript_9048/g.18283 Transcript_9048/m.18283 type:complete len:239 (-) Transcript_9048:1171-1887(-)
MVNYAEATASTYMVQGTTAGGDGVATGGEQRGVGGGGPPVGATGPTPILPAGISTIDLRGAAGTGTAGKTVLGAGHQASSVLTEKKVQATSRGVPVAIDAAKMAIGKRKEPGHSPGGKGTDRDDSGKRSRVNWTNEEDEILLATHNECLQDPNLGDLATIVTQRLDGKRTLAQVKGHIKNLERVGKIVPIVTLSTKADGSLEDDDEASSTKNDTKHDVTQSSTRVTRARQTKQENRDS